MIILSVVNFFHPSSKKVIILLHISISSLGLMSATLAAVCLATFIVTHDHTSVSLCLNAWQWQAVRHRCQTSDILHCGITRPDSESGPFVTCVSSDVSPTDLLWILTTEMCHCQWVTSTTGTHQDLKGWELCNSFLLVLFLFYFCSCHLSRGMTGWALQAETPTLYLPILARSQVVLTGGADGVGTKSLTTTAESKALLFPGEIRGPGAKIWSDAIVADVDPGVVHEGEGDDDPQHVEEDKVDPQVEGVVCHQRLASGQPFRTECHPSWNSSHQ